MSMYDYTHCIQNSDKVKIVGESDMQFRKKGVVSDIDQCGVQHDGLPVSQRKERHVVVRPAETRSPLSNTRKSGAF